MNNQKTRRLAAIMFTDIVGYTALMQQDENAAAKVRAHHRQEFQQYHKIYNGEILQYFGECWKFPPIIYRSYSMKVLT